MSSYQLVVDKCTQYSVMAYGEKLLFNLVQQLVAPGFVIAWSIVGSVLVVDKCTL